MLDTLGVIIACNNEADLGELTRIRTVSAVPFAGRYRLIDFILSAMVNSGMNTVGVATGHNYQSLLNHIGTGKPWDLARKREGLFVLPPAQDVVLTGDCRVAVLTGVIRFLERSKQHYVVVADSNNVCNIRFDDIVLKHKEVNADITVVYQQVKNKAEGETYVDTDENGSIKDVVYPTDRKKCLNRIVGYYVFTKDILINILENCMMHGRKRFVKDVIERNINRLKIYGYRFDGFLRTVKDIDSYYDVSMELFETSKRKDLFMSENKIFTKSKDRVPTRYLAHASIKNSIVADGCVIDGTVENSLVFRGVTISKGAEVKNCIIMQDGIISRKATLSCCILDKNCVIRENKMLIGQQDFPLVVNKNRTI